MQQDIPTTPLGSIRVHGADAESFLQGQLTQDVRRATPEGVWAGYCSPKGRLLAVARLHTAEGGFRLDLHPGVLEATLKRLKMFVLRSKVQLDLVPAPAVVDEEAWRRQNILDGIPVIYPQTSDHFVPQMVNLDLLGGINFQKGCYTGQEIVARLHYLGQLKRRMFLLRSPGGPASPGDALYLPEGEQAVGEVVDSRPDDAGGSLLSAVLQLAQAQSSDLELRTAQGVIKLTTPASYGYAAV